MKQQSSCPPARGPAALLWCAAFLPCAFAQSGPASTLPAVEVVGRTSSGAYDADEAAGAKTELPLRELPQSVRVITQQALSDLGATRLDDVLDYVGGMSRQQNFGGLWDNFAIRGLAGHENSGMATLLNGFAANRGFNAPRDLAGVDRIEFLKGPAAALYGASEPGGTLNIVSKRPRWKAAHAAEAYAGSYAFKRAAVDSTGPLGDRLAYRLNVALEDRGSFRDSVNARREVIAPALTWKAAPDTTLEYVGESLRHATPLDRGVVALNGQLGPVPRERFLGEPADGDTTVRNQTHQLLASHDFGAAWRGRLGVSIRDTALSGFATEATALGADGLLTRQRRWRHFDSSDAALQAELQGVVTVGGVEHELLFGAETYRFRLDQRMLRIDPTPTAPYAIDVFNPVYGQPRPAPLPRLDTLERQRGMALYLQDAVKLAPQWRMLAGLRLERVRQSLQNRRGVSVTAQDPTAVSPRLGLSWLPTPRWTVYANAGSSFRPNAGADVSVRAFEPERGTALELGAKWESATRRLGATAALFDIRKRNVLTTDPAAAGFSAAAGGVRSRGAEFDLAGQLDTRWRVNASLVWNDVSVTRDHTLEVGGGMLGVPRVNGSVLAVYEDALANGQRYGFGGGFTYVGRRLGQARTQAEANAGTAAFELPAYTTAKFVAYWRLSERWRLSLDVDNVFDKAYHASAYSRVWVTPGAPRTVTLGLQATL